MKQLFNKVMTIGLRQMQSIVSSLQCTDVSPQLTLTEQIETWQKTGQTLTTKSTHPPTQWQRPQRSRKTDQEMDISAILSNCRTKPNTNPTIVTSDPNLATLQKILNTARNNAPSREIDGFDAQSRKSINAFNAVKEATDLFDAAKKLHKLDYHLAFHHKLNKYRVPAGGDADWESFVEQYREKVFQDRLEVNSQKLNYLATSEALDISCHNAASVQCEWSCRNPTPFEAKAYLKRLRIRQNGRGI
jgi:hypothetical protein